LRALESCGDSAAARGGYRRPLTYAAAGGSCEQDGQTDRGDELVFSAHEASHWEGSAMEITEVRIKLMEDSDDRLQGFCSVTFDDCFVVRDLKIIDGASGPFVAMPSRKLTSHCHQCGTKNHLKALYCNQCGSRLREDRTLRDSEGRAKLYADIAHPINSQCREMIQNRVIAEFHTELDRAQQPGYVSRYDDDYDDDIDAATLRRTKGRGPLLRQPVRRCSPRNLSRRRRTSCRQLPAADRGSVSTGGPHFNAPAPAQREAAPESSDQATRPKPPRGEFGAGIF
jgi:stage V sporulation protein G